MGEEADDQQDDSEDNHDLSYPRNGGQGIPPDAVMGRSDIGGALTGTGV
jgi:hypothetical protein